MSIIRNTITSFRFECGLVLLCLSFFCQSILANTSLTSPSNLTIELSPEVPESSPGTISEVRRPYNRGDVDWIKVLSEEFDGDSLDGTLWEIGRFPGHFGHDGWSKAVNHDEAACFHNGQVKVANGKLQLTARLTTEDEKVKCLFADESPGAEYVSGYITTRGKYLVGPGSYIEAKIDLPSIGGNLINWVQFWTSDIDQNIALWPDAGEIDIVETLEGKACANFHYSGGGVHQWYNVGEVLCENLAGGANVFALLWDKQGFLTFYYNGIQVGGSRVIDTVSLAGDIATSFRHNIEIGYGIPKVGSTPPIDEQTMTVEYLDIYEVD